MKKYLRENMSLQQKIDFIKQLINDSIGINDLFLIKKMIGRLSRYNTPRVNKYNISRLNQNEDVVRQILDEQEISPKSAYRWFLLLEQPKDVIDLVHSGQISINEAIRRSQKIKREIDPEHTKLGKEIIEEIRKLVEEIE